MSYETVEITALLHEAGRGDSGANSHLFEIVKDQLHTIADRQLREENVGNSLQATILVDEAFMQLLGQNRQVEWHDRNHFYILAAKAMRRILVDHARARLALKRGGKQPKQADVDLDRHADNKVADSQLLDLHDALERLRDYDARQADIVELRYFGGYTVEETASLLDISASTVKQDFAIARGWLFRELSCDR